MPATYDPWNLIRQLRDDMNRALAPATNGSEDGSSVLTSRWAPAVDIKEEKDRFVVSADIPGVEPADIEVTMENGMLTIRGERSFEKEDDGKSYRRVERVYGSFHRRFSLPDTADAEGIVARGKNGVLEIVIPKKETVQPKRIEVAA